MFTLNMMSLIWAIRSGVSSREESLASRRNPIQSLFAAIVPLLVEGRSQKLAQFAPAVRSRPDPHFRPSCGTDAHGLLPPNFRRSERECLCEARPCFNDGGATIDDVASLTGTTSATSASQLHEIVTEGDMEPAAIPGWTESG